MQFKVPQNVQMEDKIVGPLTLKQLIICAVGGGISYFIYVSMAKMYVLQVWLPFTAVPAILTLAIAFVRINDLPFYKYVLLRIENALMPQKRSFQKGSAETRQSILSTTNAQTKEQKQNEKKITKKSKIVEEKLKDIDSITKILDSQGKI